MTHCHPGRNEVKSKDPVKVGLDLSPWDPRTLLKMTEVWEETCYGSES